MPSMADQRGVILELVMLKEICEIVCTNNVLLVTVRVRHKSNSSFLLLSSPFRSSHICQSLAFGITIHLSNDKLLQITDDLLCQ